MYRTGSRLRVLVLSVLSLAVAGGAQAGYWSVVYDLAGSDLETVNPGGTFNDPITGSITVEYPAVSSGAPLLGGRVVGGTISNTLSQPAGILTVTGANTNELNPGLYPATGTLSLDKFNTPVIAQHSVTGFLHCADGTGGTLGFCNAFFGTPASNNIPQAGSGTFAFPVMTFTGGTAGVGNWVAQGAPSMPQASVTITTSYVGTEISRTWVENDLPVPVFGAAGTLAVFAGLLASGIGITRRKAA